MAKIEWVDQRLDVWAKWVVNGRSLVSGAGCHPMWRDMPPDPAQTYEARVPINEEECWRTEQAVQALPVELAQTVAAYYLHGTYFAQDRLSISRAVLSQRLDRSHRLLAQSLARVGPVSEQPPSSWERSFTPLTKPP